MSEKAKILSTITYDGDANIICEMKVLHNGNEITKTISLDEYINLLSENVKIKLPEVSSGFLPCGTLATWVSEKSRKALFFVPAEKQPLRVKDKLVFIPWPSILFLLSSTGETHMWAMKETELMQVNENSKLYKWPFGHVYNDGSLCTGSVETKFKELSQIRLVVGNILSGVNSHSNNGEDMGKNIQALIKGKLENYPLDSLIPVSDGAKTISEVISNIEKRRKK